MRVARIDNGNGNAVRGLVSLQAVPYARHLPTKRIQYGYSAPRLFCSILHLRLINYDEPTRHYVARHEQLDAAKWAPHGDPE